MKRFYLQLIYLFLCLSASSQENQESGVSSITMTSSNVASGDANSSTGSVAYSIGLVFYTSIEATSNTLSQGIQNAEKIESIESVGTDQAQVIAYPNPTSNYVIIDVIDFENEYAQYQLFDSKGHLLKNSSITAQTTKLPMGNMSAATYFLRINVPNIVEKTFKIIKR